MEEQPQLPPQQQQLTPTTALYATVDPSENTSRTEALRDLISTLDTKHKKIDEMLSLSNLTQEIMGKCVGGLAQEQQKTVLLQKQLTQLTTCFNALNEAFQKDTEKTTNILKAINEKFEQLEEKINSFQFFVRNHVNEASSKSDIQSLTIDGIQDKVNENREEIASLQTQIKDLLLFQESYSANQKSLLELTKIKTNLNELNREAQKENIETKFIEFQEKYLEDQKSHLEKINKEFLAIKTQIIKDLMEPKTAISELQKQIDSLTYFLKTTQDSIATQRDEFKKLHSEDYKSLNERIDNKVSLDEIKQSLQKQLESLTQTTNSKLAAQIETLNDTVTQQEQSISSLKNWLKILGIGSGSVFALICYLWYYTHK